MLHNIRNYANTRGGKKTRKYKKRPNKKKTNKKKNEQTDANLISVKQIVVNELFKKKYIFLVNII